MSDGLEAVKRIAADMDLKQLREPFAADDIEWRVSRAGLGKRGPYCRVLAYITARAIQHRLDDVCGPSRWQFERPEMLTINGASAFSCGLSILVDGEWITKYDVAEPTAIEPAKGGWSSAVKRAASAWGVGRYLYRLDEMHADVQETDPGSRAWNWARLPEKHGGAVYYWRTPSLPGWALPKEPDAEVSSSALTDLKNMWRKRFASDLNDPAQLLDGFRRYVQSVVGEFPSSDHTCWTADMLERCQGRIRATDEPAGIDAVVPFDGGAE